jgi:hypothetical protein
MKTKLVFLISLFSGILHSQITLENSYNAPSQNSSIGVINLSIDGYKYLITDTKNATIRIYNINHSVWKTITIQVPATYSLFSIGQLSQGLFNNDPLIEFYYTYWRYTSSPFQVYYGARVENELNNSLITIADCPSIYPAKVGSSSWKLIAQIDSSGKSSAKNFNVYNLVGSLPIITGLNEGDPQNLTSSFYPNPFSEKVVIDYTLPSGITNGEIILFDLNGAELRRYSVDNSFSNIELNNGDLPSGTYLYTINAGGNSTTKKMIIIK